VLNNIFLVGGGEFKKECTDMDTWVLDKTNSVDPLVAIVPTAASHESPHKAAENGCSHFEQIGAKTTVPMILNRLDAFNEYKLNQLSQADLIYFTGGNPQHLLDTITGTPIEAVLIQGLKNGVIVAGSSAGAMIMGSDMRYQGWRKSLGICDRLAVLPHHENSNPESVLKNFSNKLKSGLNMIGLSASTGVFIDNGKGKVLGNGIVTTYRLNEYNQFRSGEHFQY